MLYKTSTYGRFLIVLLFLATLAGCGGGGSSSSDGGDSSSTPLTSTGTGSVGLLLTDGPTDDFDAVFITIVQAELLPSSDSDSGRFTIFQGNETVNLLDYRNDARIFSLHPDVPAGTYSKIRLTLSDIKLVKCEDGAVIQPINVNTCYNTIADENQPRLTGNRKLDLNPRGDIRVYPGSVLVMEIDIDANKSIHIVETGNGKYKFRPVVFVKIITNKDPGKLVRVHGIIEDLDRTDREFEICSREINLLPGIDEAGKDITCVDVTYNDNTAIFGPDGKPIEADALFEGLEATVFGHLRLDVDDDDEVEHHSAAVDDNHHDFDGVYIEALIIDIGPDGIDDTLDGIALTAVDSRFLFDMSIDPGQGFTAGSEVTVLIQPDTIIAERDGNLVPIASIQRGRPLSVDGELQLSDIEPAVLLARLIVVDTEVGILEKESGIIGLIPDKVCGFNLETDRGDRSISVSKGTLILRVTDTDATGASDIILTDDLESGDVVDIYGQDDGLGCFAAETIVVFVPVATPQ